MAVSSSPAPAAPQTSRRHRRLTAAPARAAARDAADAVVEHRRRHKPRFSRSGAW